MTISFLKSRWAIPTVAALACLATGMADATVLDFEPGHTSTTYAPFVPLLTHFDELGQGPFAMVPYSTKAGAQAGVDLVGALVDGTDIANTCLGLVCPSNNSTTFFTALNDGVLALVRSNGGANVQVQQFDASFVAVVGDTVQPDALVLRVDGYSATSLLARNDFYLPGPSGGGTYSFASYALDSSFTNPQIVEVDFYGYFCTQSTCTRSLDKAQFALDNINVVPEPAEWMLMATGLAAVGAWRRRRTL